MRKGPIVNLEEAKFTDTGNGETFNGRVAPLASLLGATKLGYRIVELGPGEKAWPRHLHHVNEEMFFVLEGTGTLRYGDDEFPLRPNDVVSCPPGTENAHQIVNTSTTTLRYLAISTMEEPEVSEYPDSGKYSVVVGSAPGGDPSLRRVQTTLRKKDRVDYWLDES